MNSTIKKWIRVFKIITVQNGNSKFQINRSSANKNVSIQLPALERGIFIEFTHRVHNQPKKLEQNHRPPTIKQRKAQTTN
jgi:hypothetical protein